MNQSKIKDLAILLEKSAIKYNQDDDVKKLMYSLEELIDHAKNMKITRPVDYVPGDYFFTEKNCSSYPDLEKSYSKFKLQITMEEEQYDDLIKWAENQKEELHKK